MRRTAEEVARSIREAAREAEEAEWEAQEAARQAQEAKREKTREAEREAERRRVTACCLHMAHVAPDECQCECHDHPRRITVLFEWMGVAALIGVAAFIAYSMAT